MAVPKHKTPTEREKALAAIERMNLQGLCQHEIAERMGVTQQQICYDLRVIRKRYFDSTLKDRAEQVGETLAQIRATMKEAWEGWDRSKGDALTTVEEESSSRTQSKQRRSTTRQARSGDPAFLATVLECIQAQRELLGLDAPKQVNAAVHVLDWDALLRGSTEAGADPVEQAIRETLDQEPDPVPLLGDREDASDH